MSQGGQFAGWVRARRLAASRRQNRPPAVPNLSCPTCQTTFPVAPLDPVPSRCPNCAGTLADPADEARVRKLRLLSETVAQLRRERGAEHIDSDRERALEERFDALASALSRDATVDR